MEIFESYQNKKRSSVQPWPVHITKAP